MKIKRNKKGFTIVEVVISMALLVTISTLSATICLSAVKQNKKSLLIVEANSISLDMIEIYKVSDNSDEVYSLIENVYGIDIENNNEFYINNIKYNISINEETNTISIISYSINNELLKSVTYEKA